MVNTKEEGEKKIEAAQHDDQVDNDQPIPKREGRFLFRGRRLEASEFERKGRGVLASIRFLFASHDLFRCSPRDCRCVCITRALARVIRAFGPEGYVPWPFASPRRPHSYVCTRPWVARPCVGRAIVWMGRGMEGTERGVSAGALR